MAVIPAGTRVAGAGAYDLSEAAYHADPAPAPSLSASMAKIILDRSLRHAWCAHPRLNPNVADDNAAKFDLGQAAHALMLGSHERFAVIDAADWRTKEAKAQRDAAYDDGRIPLLVEQWAEVRAMVEAGRAQLRCHRDAADAFTDGRPEQALIWQEGPVWCRSRLDWKPNRGVIFDDYKTTGVSAHPDAFARQIVAMGYDVQAAFYRRGIRAVLGIADPQFRFVVQETSAPFALSVIGLAPAWIDMADRKVDEALRLWSHALATDCWPGYPSLTAYVDPPAWAENQWLEREARDTLARKDGDKALFAMAMDWQAPA